MKEAIGARVGRLIAGSVNALIDAVENAAPEVVMEQALREIDGATDEVRVELGKVLATKHLANKRLLEENRKHEELGEQIELAVTQGREDLAEAAIAQGYVGIVVPSYARGAPADALNLVLWHWEGRITLVDDDDRLGLRDP